MVADRAGCRDRLSGEFNVLHTSSDDDPRSVFVCKQVTRTAMQSLMPTLAFPLSSLRSVELDEAGLTIGPLEQHATCSTVCAKLSARTHYLSLFYQLENSTFNLCKTNQIPQFWMTHILENVHTLRNQQTEIACALEEALACVTPSCWWTT